MSAYLNIASMSTELEDLTMSDAGSETDAPYELEDIPVRDADERNEMPEYDDDSAYGGDDSGSETSSLTSCITTFRTENGRTYHSYGSTEHWGPNDEEAMKQQDLSHHFWTLLLDGKYFLAPIKSPMKVLDLGTGTGIWAMDLADNFPAAHVKGMDVSPIQPSWTAPNCFFEIDDYNVIDWMNQPKYDLIHSRENLGSVGNWSHFFSQIYNSLMPGGWVDCVEPEIHIRSTNPRAPEENAYKEWATLFQEVSRKSGMTFEVAHRLKGWMEDAGFVNIVETIYDVPVGTWPEDRKQKELGLWNQARLAKGVRDFTERRMKNYMGWIYRDIDKLVERCAKTVHDTPLYCAKQKMYFVYGQKPRI